MAVSDASVVDAIGLDKESEAVVLSIADDLDWSDPVAHLETLLDKVTAYLGFVASGSLKRRFPQAAGREVRIDVVFRHEPPEMTDVPLFKMKRYVKDAGLAFSRRTLGEEAT